jgi:spore germination protein GerM
MAGPQIIDNEARAQQLSRAIASDVSLYNKAKIEEGIKNDDLFERLSEEITEGRDLFRSRVTPELFRKNFYDRAIVDRVIRPMAHVESKLW